MNIYITDIFGNKSTLKKNGALPYLSHSLKIQEVSKLSKFKINGNEIVFNIGGILPLSFDKDCNMQLEIDNNTQSFDIPVFAIPSYDLFFSLSDLVNKFDFYFNEKGVLNYKDILSKLESNELKLFDQIKLSMEEINNHWLLEEIEETRDYLIRICHRPRIDLKSEEEIRPIGAVRRIGHTAIKHIAQHSEHWAKLTPFGIEPARLLAIVTEERIELYENLLVVSLIKRLDHHLNECKSKIDEILNNIDYIEKSQDMFIYTKDLKWKRIQEKLLRDMIRYQNDKGDFDETQKKIEDLLRIIDRCKHSHLFKKLNRFPVVKSPIFSTNIITMDYKYRMIKELWDKMDEEDKRINDETKNKEIINSSVVYANYCKLLLLVSLHYAGYEPKEPNLLTRDNGDYQIKGIFINSRNNWEIEIKERKNMGNCISFNFRKLSEKKSRINKNLKNDVTYNNSEIRIFMYSGAVGDISQQDSFSKNILNTLSRHDSSEASNVLFYQIGPRREDEYNVLRRFYSFGDEYHVKDLEKNRDWSDFQTGMVNVSHWKFSSILRVLKLINLHTIRHDIFNSPCEELEECPLCSSEEINRREDTSFACKKCKAEWGKTKCPHCKHEFAWLRAGFESSTNHDIDGGSSTSKITNDDKDNYLSWLLKQETMLGTVAVNAFTEVIGNDFYKQDPVCPKCGECPEHKDDKPCMRHLNLHIDKS